MVDKIKKCGIIPIISIENADDIIPLSEILLENSITCMEITLRTSAAWDALKVVKKQFPEFVMGAGTILDKEDIPKLNAKSVSHKNHVLILYLTLLDLL